MKHTLKKGEGCARVLEVRAETPELKETEERVVRDFGKAARIPGFRVGKAPRDLVEKRYGKEIREETLKRAVPELYRRALGEAKLKPVGLPEISDVRFENGKLSFKAAFEIEPEIPLRKYKGLKASRRRPAVTPEEVTQELCTLQERQAELIPKAGVVAEGDFVVCDVEGRSDGKVTDSQKNVLLLASLKEQKHPEIVKALLGAKPGDLREADLTLESPGGVVQKAHYAIRINEVKQKRLPELNDDFVKGASPFQSVAELKEAVSKEIEERKDKEAKRALEGELLTQLRTACSFDVPRLLVHQQFKRLVEEEHLRLKWLGWTDEAIEKRLVAQKEPLLQEAEKGVRNSLILEKIAKLENVQVRPEEVDTRIRAVSRRLGRKETQEEKDLGNASLRERVAGEVLLEKTLELVVASAQIQEEG